MRAGERAGDIVQLAVMQVAQAGNVRLPRLGQHIQREGRGAVHHLLLGVGRILALVHIGVVAVDPPGIARGDTAQRAVGPRQRLVRHRITGLLGAVDEVGRIGAEPGGGVAVTLTPEAEGTIRTLTVEDRVDGDLHLVTRIVARALGAHRDELFGIEQRQRAAGDLLRAAIGVAVERGVERRRIDRDRREADRDIRRARHIAFQQVFGDAEGVARPHQLRGRARFRQVGRPGLDLVIAGDGVFVRTRHFETQRRDAFSFRRDAHRQVHALALAERAGERGGRNADLLAARDFRGELAGGEFDVVDGGGDDGFVAGGEEARHHEIRRRAVTHLHLLFSRAETGLRPGDRHQAEFAVEFRQGERNFRAAAFDFDKAGEDDDRLGRHNRQPFPAELVTADPHFGRQAHVRVEQAAIVVVQLDAERLAAEIVGDRVRRLELRQLQNAFVNSGQGQVDLLLRSAFDLHIHRLVRTRTGDVRRIQRDLEGARGHVDRHMRDADGAARLGIQHGVAAGIDRDHDIGAFAPLRRDRQRDLGALGNDADVLDAQYTVGGHHNLGLPVIGRHDGQLGALADLGRFLGGDDLHAVRRFGAVLARPSAPADIEAGTRARGGKRALAFDHQLMAAPFEARRLDLADTAGGRGQHAFIDLGDRARAAPGPLFAVAVPVIVIVDGEHFPAEALGNSGAFGIDGDDLELGLAAFLDTRFKGGLHADIQGLGPVGHADAFGDGAATGLEHADHGVEAQRQAGIRPRGAGREADDRLARTVRGRIIELEDLFLERLVVAAIGETFERLEGRRIGFQPGFGFHGQAGAGGAVEEARVDLDIPHAARLEGGLLVRFHVHGDALGHEILDCKAHFTGRGR